MGVLDDILESPPEEMTSRQVTLGILWASLRWFCLLSGVIVGVPLLLLILILIIY